MALVDESMKDSLVDDIRSTIANARRWLSCEVQYVKLTAAEKASVLVTAMALATVFLLLGMAVLLLLAFALEGMFEMWMAKPLAFLCTAGVVLLVLVVIFALRRPLLSDPVARFITRLFNENSDNK